MTQSEVNPFFVALLQEHEFRGMLGLGKIANPATGDQEVNLEMAQVSIAILEMLEVKTKGNLIESELQELQRVLTSLRINYVEEVNRPASPDDGVAEEAAGAGAGAEEGNQADGEA